jgi:hypothetical protein
MRMVGVARVVEVADRPGLVPQSENVGFAPGEVAGMRGTRLGGRRMPRDIEVVTRPVRQITMKTGRPC